MNTKTLKLLIDTNVWIDYYTGRDTEDSQSSRLVKKLLCSKHDVLASALSTKDLFYLLQAYLKLAYRKQHGEAPSSDQALAMNEVSWKCTEHMIAAAKLVSVETAECRRALELREYSNDYEDSVIVACAESCGADYIVTNDKSLHAPETVSVVSAGELHVLLFERS